MSGAPMNAERQCAFDSSDAPTYTPLYRGTLKRVFQPEALSFCARKVAASGGDLRRALEMCGKAIESVIRRLETSGDTASLPSLTPSTLKVGRIQFDTTRVVSPLAVSKCAARSCAVDEQLLASLGSDTLVKFADMTAVFRKHFTSHYVTAIEGLPTQGQLITTAALVLSRNGTGVPVKRLRTAYVKMCRLRDTTPVASGEFSDLLTRVVESGILSRQCRVGRGSSKIAPADTIRCNAAPDDIEMALEGSPLYDFAMEQLGRL